MQIQEKPDAIEKKILDGLHGINKHLAIINSRLELLLLANLPDYVKSDLSCMAKSEQEASQILHSLSLLCHRQL
jgi:uncharacterized protein YeeX (DUF496 family)